MEKDSKMAPKDIAADGPFPRFFAPVLQGVFLKAPWLILAPFWLHLARFWYPFLVNSQ